MVLTPEKLEFLNSIVLGLTFCFFFNLFPLYAICQFIKALAWNYKRFNAELRLATKRLLSELYALDSTKFQHSSYVPRQLHAQYISDLDLCN